MGADTPRAIVLGMLARERGLDAAAVATFRRCSRFAPAAADPRRRATRLACADLGKAPARVVMGDYPEWLDAQLRRGFRRRPGGGGGSTFIARAARPAGQYAQRPVAHAAAAALAGPHSRSRRAGRRWGCKSRLGADAERPGGARGTGLPSKAWSRCRTKARSLPRCLLAPNAASKSSICARELAARRWRSPPRWKTTARSMPPTWTSAASRRSMRRLERAGARSVQVRTPRAGEDARPPDLAGHADLVLVDDAMHWQWRVAAQPRREVA